MCMKTRSLTRTQTQNKLRVNFVQKRKPYLLKLEIVTKSTLNVKIVDLRLTLNETEEKLMKYDGIERITS